MWGWFQAISIFNSSKTTHSLFCYWVVVKLHRFLRLIKGCSPLTSPMMVKSGHFSSPPSPFLIPPFSITSMPISVIHFLHLPDSFLLIISVLSEVRRLSHATFTLDFFFPSLTISIYIYIYIYSWNKNLLMGVP